MTAFRYTPAAAGSWLMIVGPERLLVVEGPISQASIEGLWRAVGPSGGVQSVLDALTHGGISRTPSFGLVSWSGDLGQAESTVSAIVRGSLCVVVTAKSEAVEVDGVKISTWNERIVAGAVGAAVRITTDFEESGAAGQQLTLDSGMAWASHVEVGSLVASDSEKAQPEPKPELEPEPEEKSSVKNVPSETTKIEFTRPTLAAEKSPEVEAASTDAGESSYDYLFGETIARTVEDAAVRDDDLDAPPELEANQVENEGDHDGKTAIGLDRAARQAARRARAKKSVGPRGPDGTKLAIELSTGVSEELNQPILIGRAPSVSKVSGEQLPRLVTITGTDQDISRNHVRVAAEGGTVVVTDLHSRNGTMVILPGRPPQQLRAGEPTAVILGTVVDLGAGVTFTVREG